MLLPMIPNRFQTMVEKRFSCENPKQNTEYNEREYRAEGVLYATREAIISTGKIVSLL